MCQKIWTQRICTSICRYIILLSTILCDFFPRTIQLQEELGISTRPVRTVLSFLFPPSVKMSQCRVQVEPNVLKTEKNRKNRKNSNRAKVKKNIENTRNKKILGTWRIHRKQDSGENMVNHQRVKDEWRRTEKGKYIHKGGRVDWT